MSAPHLREVFALIDHEKWGWEFAEIQGIYRLDPGSSVVALDGKEIVGLVTCVDFGTFAFIIHVIVRKGWRGKGVGVRMVESVLAELDSRGVRTVELHANPDAVEFYNQFSFRRLEDLSFLVRQPPLEAAAQTTDDRGYAWLSPGDVSIMAEAIHSMLGYDKGDLKKALSKSPPQYALSRSEEGRPTAMVLSRVGQDINAAGPWVMEMPDKVGAERMMRAFLSRAPAKRIDVLAPSSNEVALAAFEACGFTLAMGGIVRTSRSSETAARFSQSVLAVGHVGLM